MSTSRLYSSLQNSLSLCRKRPRTDFLFIYVMLFEEVEFSSFLFFFRIRWALSFSNALLLRSFSPPKCSKTQCNKPSSTSMATRRTPGAGREGGVVGTIGCLTAEAASLCAGDDDDDDEAAAVDGDDADGIGDGRGVGDRDLATSNPLLLAAEAAFEGDEDDECGDEACGGPGACALAPRETALLFAR